jgi:predicted CoA-binding protein
MSSEEAAIDRMLQARRIAVVGLSDDPSRPSYGVARYLINSGLDVVPVNPNCKAVLGRPSYASLVEVPGPIDLVDVFRRPEYCADIARQAVAIGAKGLWLQSGIESEEARRIAESAGISFVQDRCLMIEHANRTKP